MDASCVSPQDSGIDGRFAVELHMRKGRKFRLEFADGFTDLEAAVARRRQLLHSYPSGRVLIRIPARAWEAEWTGDRTLLKTVHLMNDCVRQNDLALTGSVLQTGNYTWSVHLVSARSGNVYPAWHYDSQREACHGAVQLQAALSALGVSLELEGIEALRLEMREVLAESVRRHVSALDLPGRADAWI